MKKNHNLFIVFAIILAGLQLVGCSSSSSTNEESSNNDSFSLSPSTTKISGPLGEYFEVVDREYTPGGSIGSDLNIELKRIKEGLPEPWEEGMAYSKYSSDKGYKMEFTVEIRDENGNVLDKETAYSSEEMEALANLGVDETATIRVNIITIDKKKASKFKVGSKFEYNEGSDESSSDYSSSSSTSSSSDYSDDDNNDNSSSNSYDEDDDSESSGLSSSSGSTDWDEVLDEYDRYVDKYGALARKAKRGDADALLEYTEYMQEANALNSKLMSAKGELSVSQAARMNRISMKMARAAM